MTAAPQGALWRRLIAVAVLSVSACLAWPSMAQSPLVQYTAQLEAQGYQIESVSRTLLGRIRLEAVRGPNVRELVFDRATGEILRDVTQRSEGGDGRPVLDLRSSPSPTGPSRPARSDDGDDDDGGRDDDDDDDRGGRDDDDDDDRGGRGGRDDDDDDDRGGRGGRDDDDDDDRGGRGGRDDGDDDDDDD